ncbi:uncharacterized protein [Littorina saxatilis]|uniref:Uncharacterized protein n=1 Tax=Littorina saxatilis TaxID=31220 RepID=A0AAN9BBJ9_9CAEN
MLAPREEASSTMEELSMWSEDDGGTVGVRRRLRQGVIRALGSLSYLLVSPLMDCRLRSHPRIVPDYSVLVLMTYMANPPLGLLLCLLHQHTKNLFFRNRQRTADVLYIFIIVISHVIIGVTATCICLTVAYYVIGGQHPPEPLLCVFGDADFQYMEDRGMGKTEYCREKMRGNVRFDRPDVTQHVRLVKNGCTCY